MNPTRLDSKAPVPYISRTIAHGFTQQARPHDPDSHYKVTDVTIPKCAMPAKTVKACQIS